MREGREIHLSPKGFELLAALAVDRPKVLSKATLQERLWPDTFVTEANLSNLIAEIRQALDDRARKPVWIRTAHGFGYAFDGEAVTLRHEATTSLGAPPCWIEWGRKRFPLSIGEHVIGRDPDVEVRLEGTTVSRRHARLVVTAEGAVLEDFGSKNGTRRGNLRVTAPVRLLTVTRSTSGRCSSRSTFAVRWRRPKRSRIQCPSGARLDANRQGHADRSLRDRRLARRRRHGRGVSRPRSAARPRTSRSS